MSQHEVYAGACVPSCSVVTPLTRLLVQLVSTSTLALPAVARKSAVSQRGWQQGLYELHAKTACI